MMGSIEVEFLSDKQLLINGCNNKSTSQTLPNPNIKTINLEQK